MGKRGRVDFVIAETINWLGEMKIALKVIKRENMIAVTNFAIPRGGLNKRRLHAFRCM